MQSRSPYRALYAGMILGAGVWLLSPIFTGEREPWDSPGIYYIAGLFLAGLFAALMDPKQPWLAPVGVLFGQAVYLGFLFLATPDHLAIIGLFVMAFCTIFASIGSLVGLAIASAWKYHLRRQSTH